MARSTRAISCARSASTPARGRSRERTPDRAEEFEQARRRLVGKDVGEMGGAVQGDGGRQSQSARRRPVSTTAALGERAEPDPRRRARSAGRAPRLLHPARAGSPKGFTPRSTAASAPRTRPSAVAENRARMAAALGLAPERLLVPYQVHSPDVVTVAAPWAASARPRCDGIVTATPGLALGVTGADCGMILFADARARVVGAAHAGWKGARDGVIEATVAAMAALGRDAAARGRRARAVHRAGLLRGRPRVRRRFRRRSRGAALFCRRAATRAGRCSICTGYIGLRARAGGRRALRRPRGSTPTPTRRASSATGARPIAARADYGRLVSAIALA